MKDNFYHQQNEVTLRNLALENRRLKNEVNRFQEEVLKNKNFLDFHDRLEKDFFSADTLEDLIIKLINCLQIRPDVDFVSLCLIKQYLETMLGPHGYEHFLPGIGVPSKLRYLSIINETELTKRLGQSDKILFEKTPGGSTDIFFPDHGDEVRSHAIIPLILRRRIIGSLNIGSILSRHYYTAEMGPGLLNRLSAKLAIAIDNIISHNRQALQKEILDRDIARAAILQKDMLPSSLFQSESLQILTFFQPCQRLGGDFYDFIRLSRDRIAIIMADVAGHGISAALIAAMLKFSLQIDNIEKFPPDEMVSIINEKFCQILKHGDYITLCYGIIDSENLNMNLARAGHPYPILYRSLFKDIIELKPPGPPVGFDKKASYKNMEVKLNSGDMILFYTDGLTDSVLRKNQSYDFNQLMLLLRENLRTDNPLEKLHSEIERLIVGKELEDDTSLLIVTVK